MDLALHADHLALLAGKSILKAVTEDDDDGKGFAKRMGTSARTRSPDAAKLVQEPSLGGVKTLKVVTGSASLARAEELQQEATKVCEKFVPVIQYGNKVNTMTEHRDKGDTEGGCSCLE